MYWLYLFVGATDCFVLAIKTSEYNVIDKMLISILNVFCYIEGSIVNSSQQIGIIQITHYCKKGYLRFYIELYRILGKMVFYVLMTLHHGVGRRYFCTNTCGWVSKMQATVFNATLFYKHSLSYFIARR